MELPQSPEPPVRCMHLQSNAMAVHGEGFADESAVEYGSGLCWCNQTARPLGPDNDAVSLKACSDPDRGCHQEY
jgi:hypothetical protein